jgi:tetratricopeptide (TPR) repeat protein
MKASDLLRSGYEALRAGNYDQAVTLLTRVVELEPKNKTAWINLGQAQMGLRHYEAAIEAFKKQLDVNPYDEYAYNNLGRVYALQRRYEDAEAAFRKQLELNPLDKFAHAALGNMYVEAGRYGDAIPELEKAITLMPEAASLQIDLGTARLNTNLGEQALAAFARAAELAPTPLTWNNVAYQLALKGEYLDRAQQYAESAVSALAADSRNISIGHITGRELAITQSLGSYLDTLGWVAFARGDLSAAEKLVGAAWWITEHAEVGDHLGQIAARRGRKDDAIRWYALALNADRPQAATRERLAAVAGSMAKVDDLARQHATELTRLRSAAVKGPPPATGTADFFLLVGSDGRVEAAAYADGDEKLKPAAVALKALQFDSLAAGTQALKVVRRGTLTCASSCTLALIPASQARPPR